MNDNPPTDETTASPPSLERIKKECAAMMNLLSRLEKEEVDLRAQNQILARSAILSGFGNLLEPPAPKRRRTMKTKDNSAEEGKDVNED